MHKCVRGYLCVYVSVCAPVLMGKRMHVCTHVCMHHMCLHGRVCVRTFVNEPMFEFMHMRSRVPVCMCMHAQVHV